MFLRELEPGSKVTICSHAKREYVEFDTTVLRVQDDIVVLDGIYKDGFFMNFISDYVQSDIQITKNGVYYRFPNCKILNSSGKKSAVHYVSGAIEGVQSNRRKTLRYTVNLNCSLMDQNEERSNTVILVNVSMTGFCIKTNWKLKQGSIVECSFYDKLTDSQIVLRGKVVRIAQEDNSTQKMFGCKLIKESNGLNNFIMTLQRRKLRVGR